MSNISRQCLFLLDSVYLWNTCCDVIKGTQCSTLSTVTVNNEQCVVGTTVLCNVCKQTSRDGGTHTTAQVDEPNNRACAVLRACSQGCARTTRHTPTHNKTKEERRGKNRRERKRNKRVVLDGGGARLADAATRHHLTPTNKEEKNRRTAVSRTSTREHKQFRKQVLARAQAMGITHCPACGVKLQYNNNGQRKPNSAEADHIIPASLGGTNHPDNGRVLCAKCNSRRGNGRHGKGRARHYQKNENERDRLPIAVMPTQHSDTW